MNVNDATSVPGTNTAAAQTSQTATSQLGKDEFMKLLVAQMSNQNPLEPVEGADFVAQLATFSNLEQLTGVNDGLDRISAGQAGLLQGQTVGLVGRTAVFEGNEIEVRTDGSLPIHYRLEQPAKSVEIKVFDSSGKEVKTFSGPTETGLSKLDIDAADGLEPGVYTYEIVATNESGGAINTTTYSTRRIEGVTYEDGLPQLIAGDKRFDPADILRVLD